VLAAFGSETEESEKGGKKGKGERKKKASSPLPPDTAASDTAAPVASRPRRRTGKREKEEKGRKEKRGDLLQWPVCHLSPPSTHQSRSTVDLGREGTERGRGRRGGGGGEKERKKPPTPYSYSNLFISSYQRALSSYPFSSFQPTLADTYRGKMGRKREKGKGKEKKGGKGIIHYHSLRHCPSPISFPFDRPGRDRHVHSLASRWGS